MTLNNKKKIKKEEEVEIKVYFIIIDFNELMNKHVNSIYVYTYILYICVYINYI